jgi:hypothetical protein
MVNSFNIIQEVVWFVLPSQTLMFCFLGVLASLKVSSMIYWGSRYYLLTCALLVLPVYRFLPMEVILSFK